MYVCIYPQLCYYRGLNSAQCRSRAFNIMFLEHERHQVG